MRYLPTHAAPRERVPFALWRSSRMRTAVAAVAVSAVALVPAVFVGSPAQAAPADLLTISDAGNWEGSPITFTLTYTGTTAASFIIATNAVEGDGEEELTAEPEDIAGVTSPYFAGTDPESIAFSGPGTARVTVTTTEADGDDEGDETFELTAHTAENAGLVKRGTGTIWELPAADDLPTVSLFAPSTVPESQSTVTVTATLTGISAHDVTIPVRTQATTRGSFADATATGPAPDYTALPSTAAIVIPAQQLSGSINIAIRDDAVDEVAIQYFSVLTGEPLGAADAEDSAEERPFVDIGIVDNDATPTVSIGDAATVVEGSRLAFPITLTSLSEQPLSVNFATVAGTSTTIPAATPGDDYEATTTPTPIVIPPYNRTFNQLVQTVGGDGDIEGSETVNARITQVAGNVALGTPTTATGIITDDDQGPTLTLESSDGDEEFLEGDANEVAAWIQVTGTAPANRQVPLQINYSFADVTATNGVDYRGTSGSFTIAAGSSARPIDERIPVTIIGDRIYENPAESFNVVLTSPNNTINPTSLTNHTFTIDDADGDADVAPTWTTGDVSVVEGNSGTTMARVPIRLSSATSSDATFTASVVVERATADEDRVSSGVDVGYNDYDFPNTTVTVLAGSTSAYLDIPINGDVVYERDEAFEVTLTPVGTNVVNTPSADVLHQARVVITNDDAPPTVTFNQLAATEGSTIRVTAATVGLSQYPYELAFAVAPVGTNPATLGADYSVEVPPAAFYRVARGDQGAIMTAPGSTTPATITEIYLLPDDLDEPTETFGVTATESSASLAGIARTTGTYRINDDPNDLPLTGAISDESIEEGNASVDLTVTLTGQSDTTTSTQDFTVPWTTVDGSAKAGQDYVADSGTLTIAAGETTGTINVKLRDDNLYEGDETFYVRLGTAGPVGTAISKAVGEVTIESDDDADAPSITMPSVIRGSAVIPISGITTPNTTVELWVGKYNTTSLSKASETQSDANGRYDFVRTITAPTRIAVRANGVNSSVRAIRLVQDPVLAVSSSTRGSVSFSVSPDPRMTGQTVSIQRRNANGTWSTVNRGVSTGARYTDSISVRSGTTWTFRAYVSGSTTLGTLGGYSAAKRIRVR